MSTVRPKAENDEGYFACPKSSLFLAHLSVTPKGKLYIFLCLASFKIGFTQIQWIDFDENTKQWHMLIAFKAIAPSNLVLISMGKPNF